MVSMKRGSPGIVTERALRSSATIRVSVPSEMNSITHTRIDDVLARDQIARPLGQAHQDVSISWLELDRVFTTRNAIQRRLDEPITDPEGASAQISRFDFVGHVEKNVCLERIHRQKTRPSEKNRPCSRHGRLRR